MTEYWFIIYNCSNFLAMGGNSKEYVPLKQKPDFVNNICYTVGYKSKNWFTLLSKIELCKIHMFYSIIQIHYDLYQGQPKHCANPSS